MASKILQPYEFVEVEPCLVKGRFLGWERYSPSRYIMEMKYNGERRVVQFIDGIAYFTGRRRSVSGELLEKGANLYHLRSSPHELDGAIIDGEIYIPGGVSSDMSSIMSCSKPEEARDKIVSRSYAQTPRYAMFDIIALPKRQYITRKSLRERSNEASKILPILEKWSKFVHRAEQLTLGQGMYDKVIADGGEGVVIKDLEARYVYGSCGSQIKLKPEKEGTVTATGLEEGEGKYQGTLGALIFEGVLEGRRVSGSTSGMTDLQRDLVWENPSRVTIGKKFDVIYERISPDGKLIHPRFDRWREDL